MTERMIATSIGEARVVVRRARKPIAGLVLTHGAGGGIDARDLVHLADLLPSQGITVSLVEMPWRVQGKRIAPRPAVIDEAYRAVIAGLRPTGPFVLGGRSAGARSACRVGAGAGATGVLALAFPLHPPGKPETSRVDELTCAGVPTLVVQGERDPFGGPAEFPGGVDVVVVPGADHGLRVPARRTPTAPLDQAGALAVVSQAALEWIVRDVAGNP
ncbi:MAG: hydrolase [Marmoricola sp.]|nr:hydrolase [Marmoricola sp.]